MGNMVFNARVKDDIGISSDGEEGSNSSDSRYALFIAQNLWISLKSTLIRSQVTQLSIHTRDEFRLIQSMQSIYFDNSSDIESSSRQSTTGGSKKPVEHRIHPSHMYTVSKTSNSKKLLDTHFWDENT